MNAIIPISCVAIALLLIAASSSLSLFSRISWVRNELKKPYKRFKKTYTPPSAFQNGGFQLSKSTQSLLDYYAINFEKSELLDLVFEIRLKSQVQNESKHLVNYMTVMVSLFSLLIASLALFANSLPTKLLIPILVFTIILMTAIIIVVFFDFCSKLYVQEPMSKHLIAIEKALSLIDEKKQEVIKPTSSLKPNCAQKKSQKKKKIKQI
ncbi:hypothetical protein RJP21_27345 [Paenibacillus sp. VCA1]|uniref:hypothetical protein n=1 Tax=Paenibacillus sp. VCA1 TaxID=3039148 RepID=UPI002871B997|nr:hypothetical protein [Paenibacillus sp. VCA1]MDR9857316.1 hypothetical protein [Paenibacillus sp. VCA1]